jgi:hypothetical protein
MRGNPASDISGPRLMAQGSRLKAQGSGLRAQGFTINFFVISSNWAIAKSARPASEFEDSLLIHQLIHGIVVARRRC